MFARRSSDLTRVRTFMISDSLHAKDKEIMVSAEKLEEEVLAHAKMAKRLEEYGVLSTRAMKKLSEKQKLIQEQSRVIVEKEK